MGYGGAQSAEAATVASPAFVIGELVGSVVPVLLTPFGVLALFAYLFPTAPRRILIAAMICALLGAGAILPVLGVINFAIPALGAGGRPDVPPGGSAQAVYWPACCP